MSISGRFVMINSILNAIPSFMLLFFKILTKVVKQLIQIQSKFLWGGFAQKRIIYWVNWDKICLPKVKGGLGVKDIGLFNIFILLKWKILNEPMAIWHNLIKFRYCSSGIPIQFGDARKRRNCDSIWWRVLSGVGCDDGDNKDCFRDNMRCFLGNSIDVGFWFRRWLCSQIIKEVFPKLYECSVLEINSGSWIGIGLMEYGRGIFT